MEDRKISLNESIRNISNSQKLNTPNTTKPMQTKPPFTPPAQNVKKDSSK